MGGINKKQQRGRRRWYMRYSGSGNVNHATYLSREIDTFRFSNRPVIMKSKQYDNCARSNKEEKADESPLKMRTWSWTLQILGEMSLKARSFEASIISGPGSTTAQEIMTIIEPQAVTWIRSIENAGQKIGKRMHIPNTTEMRRQGFEGSIWSDNYDRCALVGSCCTVNRKENASSNEESVHNHAQRSHSSHTKASRLRGACLGAQDFRWKSRGCEYERRVEGASKDTSRKQQHQAPVIANCTT